MAAHIVDSGNNLHRTTNIVSGASAFTVMFWALQTAGSASGTYPILTIANGTPGVNTYTEYVQFFNDAGNYQVEATPDGVNYGDIEYFIQGVTLGVWKHLCYTRSAAGFMNFYVNGLPVQPPVTQSMAGAGLNFVLLGDDGSGSGVTHQASNYREWSVALTQAQINAELASTASVVNATGLVAFTPLTTNGTDTSGNGNNWTATGTVTYVADPTFPTGFNPNAATVISSLPGSNTESLQVTAGQAASAFFSYAPLAGQVLLLAAPSGGSGFSPLAASYDPSGVVLSWSRTGSEPIYVSVEPGMVGQTYLIEVIPGGTLTTPTATLKTSSVTPFGPGELLIPNEDTANEAGVCSTTNGALISGTVALVESNECGAVLSNGTFCIGHNIGAYTLGVHIYNAAFGSVAAPAVYSAPTHWSNLAPIASDFAGQFYVSYVDITGATNLSTVTPVSAGGTVSGTVYTLTGMFSLGSLGVDQANTTFYYAKSWENGTPTPGDPISTFTLATHAIAVLVPGFTTNLWGGDLLVVPGTKSFIIISQPNSAVQAFEVRLYSTVSGALLNTYPMVANAAAYSAPRLALDLGAPNVAFWTRTFEDGSGATTTFKQINLTTGATIVSFTIPNDSSDPTKIPLSCPFFAWSKNGGGGGGQSTLFIGTRQVPPLKIRRERTVALPIQPGNARQTLSRLEIQLQPGTGTPESPLAESKLFAQISWDYGKTWSNSRLMSVGREGAYLTRPFLNILGSGRYPVVRVFTTDTFVPVMTDGFIWVTPGTH